MPAARRTGPWFPIACLTMLACTQATLVSESAAVEPDSLRALITTRRFGEAEAHARALVTTIEHATPLDSVRLGDALNLQAEAMWRGGRAGAPGADTVAARAVAIRERTLGPDHLDVAASLHNQANLLRTAGRLDGLDERYRRVLAIRVAHLEPDDPEIARTFNDYGNLWNLLGDYTAAESLYARACEVYERLIATQRRNLAACLNNMASLEQLRGDYARARVLQERSLELFSAQLGPDHANVGVATVNLATKLIALGERDEARRLLERALEIHVNALGPDHVDVAWNLRELGSLHTGSGNLAEARRTLERAIAIHEQTMGMNHPELALDLYQLAEVAEAAGQDSEAVALHERALGINERVLGARHPRVAPDLLGLSRLAARRGDLETAQALVSRTLAIRQESLGADHPRVAETQRALGDIQWAMGDATSAFESALAAETTAREHLRLLQQSLPERLALSLAGERNTGLDLAVSVHVASPGAAQAARLADAIVCSRAIVLDEMVQRAWLASEYTDPRLTDLARELSSARERLSNLTVRGPGSEPPGRYFTLREDARANRERTERALAEASRSYRTRARERAAGLEDVRAALPPGSALVSYMVVNWRAPFWAARDSAGPRTRASRDAAYIACVVRADRAAPVIVPLGPAAIVDSLAILTWRALAGGAVLPAWRLRAAEREYRAIAAELRRTVWDPMGRHIGSSEQVMIVPDGALSLVDFAALPDSAGYLIERGPLLHYVSAERSLTSAPSRPASGRGLLAVGGPDFGPGSIPRTGPNPGGRVRGIMTTLRGAPAHDDPGFCAGSVPSFSPLPLAAREARLIEDHWNRSWRMSSTLPNEPGHAGDSAIALIGRAATEDAFRRLAPGRRVLHLATHGFVLSDRCDSVDSASDLVSGRPTTPPVTLGGLAFSGANRRSGPPTARDGILTTEEIAGLDLRGVEWTVLSACNTGIGEVRRGEGVFGLRRAFEVAGCRTLIISLWPVADETARDWMDVLYKARFSRRLDTAAAVREASRTMLERRRSRGESTHPWCWGGFIAAGDWR